MTVLGDFEVIQSDPATIGDAPGENPWTRSFNTGGRLTHHTGTDRPLKAFITLMVQGLNRTNDAEVQVNEQAVGVIFPTIGPDNNWVTQMISFEGSVLNHGDNRIVIRAVPSDNPTPEDLFADFRIMNVVCSFRQDSH